jgi:hypothetical protein
VKAAAINNPSVRAESDFYETPAWCTRLLLDQLPAPDVILDPCAGNGAVLRVAESRGFPTCGVEINEARAEVSQATHVDFLLDDYEWRQFGPFWVVTNPPYSLAFEFVQKCLSIGAIGVAMLLPINWLASRKRHALLSKHTPAIWVLPQRPAFVNNKTAACDYAWFVWSESIPPTVKILPLTNRKDR